MQAVKHRQDTGSGREWYKALILVVGWLLIFSLAKDIWQIKEGFSRIKESNERLEDEKLKYQALKQKFDQIQTDEFKEKIIREKLSMQRDGEVLVVLPRKPETQNDKLASEGAQISSNWMKWWTLIK